MDNEKLCDVYEALENMKFWRPVYESILKQTGSKAQAREALLYLVNLELEYL